MVNFILVLLILRSIISNIFIFVILQNFAYKKKHDNVELDQDKQLYFVLPVFQEQELVEETIKHLASITRNHENIRVCIVGNAKEKNARGSNPTLDAANEASKNNYHFSVLETETTDGFMAHQINYAVKHIMLGDGDPQKTWIYILNIDTRLTADGLNSLLALINKGNLIIQQSAIFLSNSKELGFVQMGSAIYQSRWTIAHEIKRLWIHNFFSFYLAHTVGHGLCINLEKLREYQYLPEDTLTEDLHFGFYLAASGESITPLKIFELADSPLYITDIFKQKFVWSFGPMLYPGYLISFYKKFPSKWNRNQIRAVVIAVQGITSYINWLVSSWVIGFFIYRSFTSFFSIVFLSFYLLEYMQCAIFFYRSKNIQLVDLLISPFSVLVNLLIHSLPADVAFIGAIFRYKPVKYKTRHVKTK